MRTARVLTVSSSGGVYLVRGMYLLPGGGVLVRGLYLLWGGVPAPGGCTWPRGCTWSQGGVPGPRAPGPGGLGCTCLGGVRYPPCEQNDKQVQKYYLAPNFVCGR